MDRSLANRMVTFVFVAAVAVSIVHYADNYLNYEDYPLSDELPNPSQDLVGLSWFLFTAVGVSGYLLFLRGRNTLACFCLGIYAGSGLVGIGHYAAGGMTDAAWWRQTHIVADIALGIAMAALAVYFAFRPPPRPSSG